MVGQNYYKAEDGETMPALHRRISAMVKARGKSYANIILGDPENAKLPKGFIVNDDGSPKLPEGPHILNWAELERCFDSLSVPMFASVGAPRLDAKHLFNCPNGKGLHDR
jgi:hypothetical protein